MTYLVICNNEEKLRSEIHSILMRELAEFAPKQIAKLEEFTDPDIHFLNGFDDTSLGIDAVRSFSKILHKKPFKAKVQLGIILGFERATTEAQNAMLKEFEDHASNVIYILGVKEENNLLATIRSRATIIYVAGQINQIHQTELQELAEGIISQKSEIIGLYALISKKEWTREQAEQFLSQVYEFSRTQAVNTKLLTLLQRCAEYLKNNISPKQVLSFLLFSYRLEV